MGADGGSERATDRSHQCAGPVPVLLIGTIHLDRPDRDLANASVDDVRSPANQAAIASLVDDIAGWNPTVVAVEAPVSIRAELNDLYRAFCDGEYRYDTEAPMPEPFPDSFVRNEVVQLGFRLAEAADLDRVEPIDHEPTTPSYTTQTAMAEVFESLPNPADVAYEVPEPAAIERDIADTLEAHSLDAVIRRVNQPSQLEQNHRLMFSAGFEHDDTDAGIGVLAAWYERNLRTLHTVWSRCSESDRVALLIGTGHVNALAHLIEEAPMFSLEQPFA